MEAKWVAITAIAPIAWGTSYFVTRQWLPVDYPLWGGLLRALPAGLLLLLIVRTRPRGSWWWRSLVLGALNIGAFFVLVYLSAQLLPSSIASTLMASSSWVMLLLAWPLLSERPRILSLVGAAVGFTGVCVMLLSGDATVNPWGVVAALTAMTMSSIGYILTRRWGGEVDVLALASWQLIAGSLLIAPVALVVEGGAPALDASALLGFTYLTVVATAVAFVAWFSGLKHLTAGAVGLVGLLNPVTGVLLGVLIAGEPFGIRQAAGVALVIVGVLIGQRWVSRPARLTIKG